MRQQPLEAARWPKLWWLIEVEMQDLHSPNYPQKLIPAQKRKKVIQEKDLIFINERYDIWITSYENRWGFLVLRNRNFFTNIRNLDFRVSFCCCPGTNNDVNCEFFFVFWCPVDSAFTPRKSLRSLREMESRWSFQVEGAIWVAFNLKWKFLALAWTLIFHACCFSACIVEELYLLCVFASCGPY